VPEGPHLVFRKVTKRLSLSKRGECIDISILLTKTSDDLAIFPRLTVVIPLIGNLPATVIVRAVARLARAF
jgi:hypothetical protein